MAKACEAPAGIARLAGFLRNHDRKCTLLDGNIESQLFLLADGGNGNDTWSRRALKNIKQNLEKLRQQATYENQARYQRAVADTNKVLDLAARDKNVHLSLNNYQDRTLSPLKSNDLVKSAASPEKSIFFPWFSKRLPEIISSGNFSRIGFSLNYLSQALATFAMIGFLKKEAPQIKIILGGGLITSWMRKPNWKNPFSGLVDQLFAGPGELKLLGFPNSEQQSLYATPDYNDLPLTDYLAPGIILPYSGSSGCYWNKCSFCPEKAEDNPYIHIPADKVMADLDHLLPAHNPLLIHFLDNAISPSLMRALIKRKKPTPWYGFARLSELLTDGDFCRNLKQSGCLMLKLGLESGDQGVLDAMDKGINLAMASTALRSLEQAGIATYVYLLFGTPHESISEARKTLEFTARHSSSITFLNLAIFNMPLGGEDAAKLGSRDFYEGDLSLYGDFTHPRGWQRKEVRTFLDREFKRQPAITKILQRDPYLFTSNHAPFFTGIN